MIDRERLLRDLQREVSALEDDLRDRATADTAVAAHLRAEHTAARDAGRTAQSFDIWRDEQLTQSAVAWVLACVFLRFLEDNGLLPTACISGPGAGRQLALDQRQLYFRQHPTDTDREYLQHVFREVAALPAAGDLLGERHNPLWALTPSGDGAARLLSFFQRLVPETGEIAHDFTDADWNTRFLGDLYQDLSEAARKKFALLQTPEFVEEFILDRTLNPAIETFGFKEVRLIDPTCGSGHFLLGTFHRLFALHVHHEPGTNSRELAQRALDQIAGVDLNPFAVAIARFRLLLAALKVSRISRLSDAPGFRMHLATGDSLLHGRRFGLATMNLQPRLVGNDPLRHVYEAEDADALREILGRQYHVVVGNPPYITVKDKALNQAYRDAYRSCHMKYSVGVPFTERFLELALGGDPGVPAGFVGLITANSFMKREFGKKLIEDVLPKLDLTHVIDTSGAYIPGHGTPTVMLFGHNRPPVAATVRTLMGIRGEPETPNDPGQGLVWRAIREQIDVPGSEGDYVSVEDYARSRFSKHPWSLGGGGAAELKELLEAASAGRLGDSVESIGITCFTLEDDLFLLQRSAAKRHGLMDDHLRRMVIGEAIRDWSIADLATAVFPYSKDLRPVVLGPTDPRYRYLWRARTTISNNKMFGRQTKLEAGLLWSEYGRFTAQKLRTTLSIAFASVASHNHFALDRGGKLFKQSAPVIKLARSATDADHIVLLGLLNSSLACFWMKQVFYPKGTVSRDIDKEGGKPEANRYDLGATGLEAFPLPPGFPESCRQLAELTSALEVQAAQLGAFDPGPIVERWANGDSHDDLSNLLRNAEASQESLRRSLVAFQEEIDWEAYRIYRISRAVPTVCLHASALPGIRPEWRPFAWVSDTCPHEVPYELRHLYQARREVSKTSRRIGMIEAAAFKRPWLGRQGIYGRAASTYAEKRKEALGLWLRGHLELPAYWPEGELRTTARLADRARQDGKFMKVAELYSGHPDFDVDSLVTTLVAEDSVPVLPVCRYTPAGLRKREQWDRTWDLQRKQDAIDARTAIEPSHPDHLSEQAATELKKTEVGDIPVPPRYTFADFQKSHYWSLRGKLDVPNERFVSFPHCERDGDTSLVVGWAGWNHLQHAQAVAAYYVAMKDTEGWPADRLVPLLAALRQLVPWLEQWHNAVDPEFEVGMGDFFRGFVETEARALETTPEHLTTWQPPAGKKKRAASG